MDSVSPVSPSIVLPLSRCHHHHRRRQSGISFTCINSRTIIRISNEFPRRKLHMVVHCKLSGGDEKEGENDRRDEELERALRLDGTIPGTSDAFVEQVSSRAYDMRRHLQQSFDSSSYDGTIFPAQLGIFYCLN